MMFGLPPGIPIRVDRNLCQERPIRPRRPHRKKRIRNKWIKRYGWVMGGCPTFGYNLAGFGIVACPHWVAVLKSIDDRKRNRGEGQ